MTLQIHPTGLITSLFKQLSEAILSIDPAQYVQPCTAILGASVGQHVRHILEVYQCLLSGYTDGKIDYESRKRDIRLEQDPDFARHLMDQILSQLNKDDRMLTIHGNYQVEGEAIVEVSTTYLREVLYNMEHTIHHMALVRIALETFGAATLQESFGVAPATVKHRRACAQ